MKHSLLFERFCEDMSVRWIDPFVIILSCFCYFKSKLFVKFQSLLIVDLNVKKDRVEIGVMLSDVFEYVFQHFTADSLSSVLIETAQSHNVETATVWLGGIHPTTNCSNHNIVIESYKKRCQ